MTRKKPSTQEAILLATIDCINQHGIEQVTTRMIAEAAEANIASINYYFRTKDQLIEEVMKMTITHMLEDVIVAIENQEQSFRNTLEDIFYYLIMGTMSNPGIATAHIYSIIVEKDYQSVSGRSFLAALERMITRATQAFPAEDPPHLRTILVSILSSIMFMMLTPGFFPLPDIYQFQNEQGQRALAGYFTHMFYAMLETSPSRDG